MEDSPIILIAGQEKCGKSSIVDVVFKRMSVYNTFFLDATPSLKKFTSTKNPFLDYTIWELPSDLNEVQNELVNLRPYMHRIAVLIYVFSLENSVSKMGAYPNQPIQDLLKLVSMFKEVNDLYLSVFFHKSDLSVVTEVQNAYQKTVQDSIREYLNEHDSTLSYNCYRTSIYDNSIFDGISKCIQRILPRRSSVQNLLNSLSQSCNMDKVYLFDTYSKLCIAMDSIPNESGLYELSCDSIDVVFELVNIYCKSEGDSEPFSSGTLAELIDKEEKDNSSYPIVSSIILEKAKRKYMIYFYQSIRNIAFVCVLREDSFDKMGLINYNLSRVSDCLKQLFSEEE